MSAYEESPFPFLTEEYDDSGVKFIFAQVSPSFSSLVFTNTMLRSQKEKFLPKYFDIDGLGGWIV